MEIKYGILVHSYRELCGVISFPEPTRRERISMAIRWFLTRLVICAGVVSFLVFAIVYDVPLQPMLTAFMVSFVFGYVLNR